jgi:ubiquitin carboxyl-terminal hydrolase 26/29/37
VNHLGHSSNSGHYICDVYNLKTKTWSIFDDSKVETMNENDVLFKRSKTGYIFFYIHK